MKITWLVVLFCLPMLACLSATAGCYKYSRDISDGSGDSLLDLTPSKSYACSAKKKTDARTITTGSRLLGPFYAVCIRQTKTLFAPQSDVKRHMTYDVLACYENEEDKAAQSPPHAFYWCLKDYDHSVPTLSDQGTPIASNKCGVLYFGPFTDGGTGVTGQMLNCCISQGFDSPVGTLCGFPASGTWTNKDLLWTCE